MHKPVAILKTAECISKGISKSGGRLKSSLSAITSKFERFLLLRVLRSVDTEIAALYFVAADPGMHQIEMFVSSRVSGK